MYAHTEQNNAAAVSHYGTLSTDKDNDVVVAEKVTVLTDMIEFGVAQVVPGARMLLLNGAPVEMGSRAFDVLMILLSARGRIVPKETIMRQVWPTTTVEETNLRVQLSAMRRALGDERWRVKTVPGRGYFFVAEDTMPTSVPAARALPSQSSAAVIIIDDDCEVGDLLRRMLVSAGARIERLDCLTASFLNGN
jgi:DNA-binding winged helix-turn-helix (wHTH) protein